ncbi:hypothetical protein H696_05004 [Fonticula alba]|uniref:Uncharacterized protein n=1 Tax=Fonticula alba TaxID=691883 RepID=A0A058Z3J7_FONAL|nr:hypothetical protein H696_05004 [Fonticula alba]KCV68716.1 hypothetical protein H696_05004 [Fonticula alba]|eukprot:XP_009497148.1 hypothetical protein H696_05004 [Fonticula alba]
MDLERSILDGSYFAAQQRDTEGDRRGADSGASSGGEYSDCAEGDCGDSDHDHDDGEAAGLPPAAMAAAAAGTRRPGPQTGVKGVIADARHAARQKADARRREKEARRAASAAPSAALSDDDDSGLDSDDCEIDRLLRGDLEDGILADDLLDEFKDILRLQREKEHERTISRLEGLGFGSLARLTKHNFVAHIEARVGPRVPTVVHFYSKEAFAAQMGPLMRPGPRHAGLPA